MSAIPQSFETVESLGTPSDKVGPEARAVEQSISAMATRGSTKTVAGMRALEREVAKSAHTS